MRDVQMADAELTAAGEAAPIVTSASQTAPPTAALADRVMTSLDDAAMVDVVRTATPSPAASCEEEAKSSLSGEQQQQASMPADSASMEITPAASLDPTPSSVASVISVASVPSAGPAAAALSSTLVLPSAIGAPTSAPQLDAPVDPFDPKLHWVQAGSYVDKDPTKPLQLPCALQLVHECAALETNVIPAKAVASAQKDNIKNKWKEQDCWLALHCTEQLGSMEISRTNGANGTASSHPAPLKPTGHLVMLAALIYTLGARVDAQDKEGWTCVHWLVFNLLWHSVGTGRLVDGEVNLRDCKRFSTEIQETLAVILQAADKIGYARPETKDEAEESGKEKQIQRGSLLDIKDNAGNTALHYAVSHARVDAVALLLSFGAHYEPKNNCGESPWTDGRIDWMNKADEAKSTATAMPTANSNAMMDTSEDKAAPLTGAVPFVVFGSNVHPLIQHFDTKLYESTEFEAERAWGLREGLRLEQPSYVGESDTAAIRRLLFQAALAHATDEGDNGSLSTVKKLVKIYKHESVGKKMFPLAYRGDAFYYSPLQTAVAYEDTSTGILDQLLQLPFLLHTQSRATEFPALTRAIFCRNFVGAKHLLEAGYNVNFRDSATGATAITAVVFSDESNAEVLQLTSKLLEFGADPCIPDDEGNCALMYCVWAGNFRLLKSLTAKLSKEAIAKWIATPNKYGVYPMHHALYRQLPLDQDDVDLLECMLELGGSVDGPKSEAGLTPLQVWTGSGEVSGDFAVQCAELMKKDLKQIRQLLTAGDRKKVTTAGHGKQVIADLSGGVERKRTVCRSAYEVTDADKPRFKYTNQMVATPESEAFLKASTGKAAQDDKEFAERIYLFRRETPTFVKLSHLEVRMTPNRGWGLFTTKAIKKEDAIAVDGEVITAAEERKRMREYLRKNEAYLFRKYEIHDHDRLNSYFVDNKQIGNLARFLNHSCKPNFSTWTVSNGRQAVLYADDDIPASTELTISYDEVLTPRACCICRCGEDNCTGRLI